MKVRDLEGMQLIPDLARAGVAAIKIEGRFKSPHYVKVTTRAARYVLDALKEGRDPALPRKLLRALDRTYYFGRSPGYFKSQQPEPDCLCLDGGSRFNRILDFARNRGTLAIVAALIRHSRKPDRAPDPGAGLVSSRQIDPQVSACLAAEPVARPRLVVDTTLMYPVIPKGADRICVGERHCAAAFLYRAPELRRLLEEVKGTGAEAYVMVPSRVREYQVDGVLEALSRVRDVTDGVLCYDLGVARQLSGEIPVTVGDLVLSRRSYSMLAEVTGARAVRPLHFPLPLYLESGLPAQAMEVPVFGHMTLDGTLMCLSRIWTGCPEQEPRVFPVRFEGLDLMLAGTTLYSGKIYSAHQVRSQLLRLQPAALVLDAFHQDKTALERVLRFWRGEGDWPLSEEGLCNAMLAEDSLLAGFGCGGSRGGWGRWLPDLAERVFGPPQGEAKPLAGGG
jgi:hypothetical protein